MNGNTHVAVAGARYLRWLVVTQDLSPHTLRAYAVDLSAFERHLGPGKMVGKIDQEDVVGFVEALRAAGLAPRSIRRRASGVRGFCRWVLARQALPADPWVGVQVGGGRTRRLPRVVPGQELERLLMHLCRAAGIMQARTVSSADVLDHPHEATTLLGVALMVTTGLRVGEMVTIDCESIDLPGRSLRVTGKGRRERRVFLTNDWITALMKAYIETRAAVGITGSNLLFNRRGAPLTASAMRARLEKAGQASGLAARVTPHMLRHTAATQLIEAGVDIRYIQRLLGHASLTTTEIYTHISDAALQSRVSTADVLGRSLEVR